MHSVDNCSVYKIGAPRSLCAFGAPLSLCTVNSLQLGCMLSSSRYLHSSDAHSVSNHRKVILTGEQAVEIYKKKMSVATEINVPLRKQSQSRLVAQNYGVSPKTVRDIWNRKTWVSATQHLLTAEEKSSMPSLPSEVKIEYVQVSSVRKDHG